MNVNRGVPRLVPFKLHEDDRDVVVVLQRILDHRHGLIQTDTRIAWKSATAPVGGYLKLNGSVITNSLVDYARHDATFTVCATTTALPNEVNTCVTA